MSVETRKVLEMLTEGKITAADAERLLDKLNTTSESAANEEKRIAGTATAVADAPTKKFLRVLIERPGLLRDEQIELVKQITTAISEHGALINEVQRSTTERHVTAATSSACANESLSRRSSAG